MDDLISFYAARSLTPKITEYCFWFHTHLLFDRSTETTK